ncbi:MAG: hypothetical protein QFF03_11235 [Pseudomonadota bacterium]|nr:hypothetical protein [Pseudomonadota bacterium]
MRYTIARLGGQLTLSYPRGRMTLMQQSGTAFSADYPIGRVQFDCRAEAPCSGMSVTNGRVRKLQFSRVTFAVPPSVSSREGAPPFASEAMYLRGSMNAWGLRDRLQASGAQRYAATVPLEKGLHEFNPLAPTIAVSEAPAAH